MTWYYNNNNITGNYFTANYFTGNYFIIGSTATGNYLDWQNLENTASTTTAGYEYQSPREYEYQSPREYEYQSPRERIDNEELKNEAKEKEAKEKAKNLLMEYLDEDNKQRFLDGRPLEIVSNLFEHIKYEIPISKTSRIKAMKDNKIISELCILVEEKEPLPLEDVILTKLLYISNDEEYTLKRANHRNLLENFWS